MIINKAFLGAIGYLTHHASYLGKVLRVPFVLYVLLNVTGMFVTSQAVVFVITLLSVWFQAMIAIMTHRVILTGSVSLEGGEQFEWGQKDTLFVMFMMMFFMLAAPVILVASISKYLGIIAAIAAMWAVCRWSLVFPGLAVGEEMDLKKSWDMTQNNQLDMFVAVVLFPGILLIVLLLFSLVPGLSYFSSLLAGCFIILQAALLSVIYKIIVESKPDV